jgi:hypothetical protein
MPTRKNEGNYTLVAQNIYGTHEMTAEVNEMLLLPLTKFLTSGPVSDDYPFLGVFNPRNATDKWPELDLSHSRVR